MSLGKIIKHAHFSQKFQKKEEKTEQKKINYSEIHLVKIWRGKCLQTQELLQNPKQTENKEIHT